jgi:replicative DNA helicase
MELRQPPHSVEAEIGVLGSATRSADALSACLDKLTIDHFYVPAHQLLFAVFAEQSRNNKPLVLTGLTQELMDGFPVEELPPAFTRGRLERNGRPVISIEEVGGPAYLTQIFTAMETSAALDYFAQIVREKFLARVVIARCTELVRVAYDELTEIGDVLEQAQSTLTEIIMQADRPDMFRDLKEGAQTALEKAEMSRQHRATLEGIGTGFHDFDRMTHGLRGGQLVIIGARPGQGKTSLAMNVALNMAKDLRKKHLKAKEAGRHLELGAVGVFSMEMSYQEIVDRMFCATAGISLEKFRGRLLSNAECDGAVEHAARLLQIPVLIDDTAAITIAMFKARARLMKVRNKVRAIIVDYVQLMRSLSRRAQDNLRVEVKEISGVLKATAKELDIPIIACCQLNREAEARDTSFCKPRLSDLAESGALEQDADIVTLLWRPERHLAPPKFGARALARVLQLKDEAGRALWLKEPDEKKSKRNGGEDDDESTLSVFQVSERDRQIREYAGFLVVKQRNGPVKDLRLRFVADQTLFQNVTKELWSNDPAKRQAGYE